VVDSIKYDFNSELVPRLFERIKIEVGIEFDFIVPVPLHFHRKNWRGFNQAEAIGRVLSSQISGTRFEDLLIRKVNTSQQVKMTSKTDRQRNVKNVFCLKTRGIKESKTQNVEKFNLVGKKVLLVDDVFTTGASMGECCKVLKMAGVSVVWGFALAH
jgi:ComF family protein